MLLPVARCLCIPSSWLVFRLIFLCRPYVGPSAERITGLIVTGLIVPANSNLVPRDSACTLSACLLRFSFFSFGCFLCIFFPFLLRAFVFPLVFFRCTSTYHGFVPGIVWLQEIRDVIPQLVGTVPFAYWYYGAPNSYLLFFFHQEDFSLFCDHGPDLGEIELMWEHHLRNIVKDG